LFQPEEPAQFSSDDCRDGDKKHATERDSQPTEPADPREKPTNEIIKRQGQPKRDQPGAGRKRHKPPADALSPRVRNGIDCGAGLRFRLQRLEFGFREGLDYRIIETECTGPTSRRVWFTHASLSPIR